MKNLLLACIFSTASFYSMAQQQIPNGDFENWVYYPYCFGLDSLENFLNGEAFTYLNTKKTLGSATCPSGYGYKAAGVDGGYGLSLGPMFMNDEYYYNFVTLGKAKDFGTMGISSEGIPFTGRPTKLTGYYQYYSGVASDAFEIKVFGSNLNTSGDLLFYGEFLTSTTQDYYLKFEIDLEYNPIDPTNPTTLQLLISVGNSNDGSINENTFAIIDDLVFEYDTPTSTTNYTAISPINVYAANKNINFSENVSDVHIVDMVGVQKIAATDTKTLNAASLTAGMYIVTYKYNDAYFSKKIAIE